LKKKKSKKKCNKFACLLSLKVQLAESPKTIESVANDFGLKAHREKDKGFERMSQQTDGLEKLVDKTNMAVDGRKSDGNDEELLLSSGAEENERKVSLSL
jgi:hypothetical protein